MPSTPQVPPVARSTRNKLSQGLKLRSNYPHPALLTCPYVLLVGRNGSWGSSVLKPLEKFGCELSCVPPEAATAEFVSGNEYTLILLDSTVSPQQRKALTAELVGSRASIFYSFPVENGCWWLPALVQGQDCHGAPAFRRSEFPAELERILLEHTAKGVCAGPRLIRDETRRECNARCHEQSAIPHR